MGISIDEKRVYDASEGPTPVYVVGDFGVARVNTSDDLVGEFGLARECSARDAAGRAGRLAVATDEDVLVGAATDDGAAADDGTATDEGTAFEPLGVGAAVAVGYAGDELIVAHDDGAVRRGDAGGWTDLGDLADVRAIDGDLLAAESGVYRATDAELRHAGLDDVRDVAAGGAPLAATAEGLYRLGNGWMDELDGDVRAVSAGRDRPEESKVAHAAGESGLFAREEGEWREVEVPAESGIVALDHGAEQGAYAVTEDGTFLLSVGDGWNHQILGLRGVRAVAAP